MSLSKKLKQELIILMNNFNDNNKDETIKKIHELVLADNPKPRTQSARFSRIKSSFNTITADDEFLDNIKPDKSITNNIIKENLKIRDDRRLINIDKDLINKIMSFEDSNDPEELAIYLLLVSGRRVSELLEAEFINKKKNKNIVIKGIKKRTDFKECEFQPLINKTKFFKLLKRFNMLKRFIKIDTFHRNLNNRIKSRLGENYKPHLLRGIYAIYSYKFRNRTDLKINTFIQKILCHQSINSSLNYTQYKILFDKDIIK